MAKGPGVGVRAGAKQGMSSSAPPRLRTLRLGRLVSSCRAEPCKGEEKRGKSRRAAVGKLASLGN